MVGTGLNGEVISGISLTFFGIMLWVYGTVNQVAAVLIPAEHDYNRNWHCRHSRGDIYK